jgi:signal transduction histidine kinase
MDQLIHSLLAFGRLAPKSVHPQLLGLDELLRPIVGNDPKCELVKPLPAIFADPQLASTLFRELISNALKFHLPGGAARIIITGQSAENRALVSVEDFGIGISDECRTRLFQPFHRFCADGSYAGAGMGLAIAARAAHLIGGSIRLDHGRGPTRFIVDLPSNQT